MGKLKDKQVVLDHGKSFQKEKMKRSLCRDEVESLDGDKVIATKSPSPTLRKCDICSKIFSSGKAFGGHRKSHFQTHKKKAKVCFSSKGGNSKNRTNCDYNNDDGKHICCICKKELPTKRSLFGHMRAHPKRSWKGVCPPTHPSSLSFFSDDHDHNDDVQDGNREISLDEHHTDAIDLENFTSPSWLKKDVRGRGCVGVYEAAETLAHLSAYSKYFCVEYNSVLLPKKDEVLSKSTPPNVVKDRKSMIGKSSSFKHGVKKIKFHFNGELLKIVNKADGSGECNDDEGDKLNRCKAVSQSVIEKFSYMDDDEEEDVNTEVITPARMLDHVYERKVNMDQKRNNGEILVLKPSVDHKRCGNGNQERVSGYKRGGYVEVFSTFQHLGGHKSIQEEKIIATMDQSNHSENMMDDTIMNEATFPAAEKACQSSGTKNLDFNLNVLPCVLKD